MGDVRTTQGEVYVAAEETSPETRVTQGGVFAAYSFPTPELRTTSASIRGAVTSDMDIRTTQSFVLVAVIGRTENRRVRAWTFSLDGHDFYVLRLGEEDTVVCDLTTGQWMDWESPGLDFLRQQVGTNWLGMGKTTFNSTGLENNVVAGDDQFGQLWVMDPDLGYDEGPQDGAVRQFDRQVVGGIPMRRRETMKCGAVYLTASIGSPSVTGSTISLRTSDDNGKTWQDHGTITATVDDYDQEFVWRSLGLIKAPGRIFEITDNGATVRIDGLDMR